MGSHGHGSHHRNRHLSAVPSYGNAETYADTRAEAWSDYLQSMQVLVGGYDELMRLDAEPLPNEEFEWSTVEPQDRAFVTLVLALVDRYCEEVLDDEYRTIARRILARVAARDPRVLRRSQNTDRFAAGLVWLAGRGSGRFERSGGPPSSRELWQWFGVTDCSDRGRSLRIAADLFPADHLIGHVFPGDLALDDAALLHSCYRKGLVMRRDTRRAVAVEDAQRSPVVSYDGNQLVVAAQPVAVLGAAKSLPVEGERQGICIILGTELDNAECYDVSIPDAHKLVQCLQVALDEPPPPRTF
jgi:hypothetical protein